MASVVAQNSTPAESGRSVRTDWYEFRDGLRHVKPYFHTFRSFAKGRWVGKRVFDVLTFEFPDRITPEMLAQAVADGTLRLNGRVVASSDIFRDGDKLEHDIRRDEPPVPNLPIQLLQTGQPDLIAVSKPAGVPVHHAGRYRRNTVVEILQAERPDVQLTDGGSGSRRGGLHILHRLDCGVSGAERPSPPPPRPRLFTRSPTTLF